MANHCIDCKSCGEDLRVHDHNEKDCAMENYTDWCLRCNKTGYTTNQQYGVVGSQCKFCHGCGRVSPVKGGKGY